MALVCSEDGKFDGSVPNRMLEDFDLIFGPFIICGLSSTDFAGIPEKLIPKYMEKFRYPEVFSRNADGELVCLRLQQ